MIKAAVISNGLHGIENYFVSNNQINYTNIPVTKGFNPEIMPYDLLIVPNGSDHIALYSIKSKIAQFLEAGKSLFCFDGWFTSWMPGNQWIMDNQKKSIDVRYSIKTDTHNILNNIDIDKLIYNHNISGWWACGYIDAASQAEVLLEDTWQRPIIILDEKTTNGTIIATASGPLGDSGAIPSDDENSYTVLGNLYQNMLGLIIKKTQQ